MRTFERPLRDSERRWLRRVIAALRTRVRQLTGQILAVGLTLIGVLGALTLAFASADWRIVVGFWLFLGGSIGLWVYVRERGHLTHSVRQFDSALARNCARITEIQSSAVVEIEEPYDDLR